MMKDMKVGGSSSGSGSGPKIPGKKDGGNPFGPYAMNEREDRYVMSPGLAVRYIEPLRPVVLKEK
jgi:hypothetical protein